MNQMVKRGKAPQGVRRVDAGKLGAKYEKPHVHFEDGSALNIDGSWKHGKSSLTRAIRDWLRNNGWDVPSN